MNQENQTAQQLLVAKIKDSKNILVTVSANPSVDQLAACLGLTIWLNKIDKHATAVFSGEVPSTLEFLQPDSTLEKNTDSLRDFIISLDKSKADKLRYKVEDSVVKVFVTPYRTSLSVDDLAFSQGDFNIDMVIALGVHNQTELDTAITAHGRILHDATVATITTGEMVSELGSIGWHDQQASSLSELVVDLVNEISKDQIDEQIATALLTGVVAETDRFSNSKTTPQTMSVSAQLMSAGANQQLVATKLSEPLAAAATDTVDEPQPAPAQTEDGALSVAHDIEPTPEVEPIIEPVAPEEQMPVVEETVEQPEPAATEEVAPAETPAMQPPPPDWMPQQPWMDAAAAPAPETPVEEPTPSEEPALADFSGLPSEPAESTEPDAPVEPAPEEVPLPELPTAEPEPVAEAPVQEAAPEAAPEMPAGGLDAARDEVMKAINDSPDDAGALDLHHEDDPVAPATEVSEPSLTDFNPAAYTVMNDPEITQQPTPLVTPEVAPSPVVDSPVAVDAELTGPVDQPFTMPLPGSPLTPPPANPVPPTSVEFDPTAPPPVPPPMPFTKQ